MCVEGGNVPAQFWGLEKIMGNTRTRADLTEAVYKAVGFSRQESGDLVENVLEIIANRLEQGENVKLSSFGTFQVRAKNERIGRNPKTGQEVSITPRRVLTFRSSHVLKERINASLGQVSSSD